MRLAHALTAIRDRLHRPVYWLVVLGFPALFLAGFLMIPRLATWRGLVQAMGLLLFWAGVSFAAPLPWQWSGDDRPLAGWVRGGLQALAYLLFAGGCTAIFLTATGKTREHPVAFWAGLSMSMSFVLAFPLLGIGIVGSRLERAEREAEEARLRAQEVEWMGHRGAFSPHLLFRNLHHLAGTASRDALGTEQGMLDLATLYRRWLMAAEQPLVPFSAERALAEQYLALEKHRWGANLRVRWVLEPDLDDSPLPSLILLPFLEALLGEGHEGPLVLEFQMRREEKGRLLAIRVEGAAPPPEEAMLAQIRHRLQTAIPGESEVATIQNSQGWSLHIQLPSAPAKEQP
ncbi:MAG: histidine kinase [Firmicutes bacterium]|nr:histidine kinase [Bacillota bacterium]